MIEAVKVGTTEIFWYVFNLKDSVHSVPMNDLRDHIMDKTGSCWCHPIEDDEYVDCWIHNSMDRREDYKTSKAFH